MNPGLDQAFFRLRAGASNPPVGIPPTITSQPQNQSAAVGQGALFSVAANASTPLCYQWYFNTNTPITDATNATHTISSVTSNDAGSYHVIVANRAGAATSTVATLSITSAPTNGDWFVSLTGNDANPGTMALPFATLGKAASVAQPGHVIYLRGGTYFPAPPSASPIPAQPRPHQSARLPGEKPYFNFTNQPYGAANRGILFATNAIIGT